jgi:uncharacterized membrane protein HdeD (DUF308 family)
MPDYIKGKLKVLILCLVAFIADTYWVAWLVNRYPDPSPMWVITGIWSIIAGVVLLISVIISFAAIVAYYEGQ